MQDFFKKGEEIPTRQEEEETNNTPTEKSILRIPLGDPSATTYCDEHL